MCLKEFGNNPEGVINRVLEGSLPPHLSDADFTLASSEDVPAPPMARGGGRESGGLCRDSLVDQRESVYDGDEFDVLRAPGQVDLSRVHIGKK